MDLFNSTLNGVRKAKSGNGNAKIQFGILVKPNVNNSHYLQDFDILKSQYVKVGNYYLKEMSRKGYAHIEDMIDDAVRDFRSDAQWIRNLDGSGYGSSFSVVAYLTDKGGNIVEINEIKQLLF